MRTNDTKWIDIKEPSYHYKVSFLIAFVQIDSTCIRSELTTRVRYQEVG